MRCKMGESALMARHQAQASSHLAVVSGSTDAARPGVGAATRISGANAPILAGLLVCHDGGHAVGVVREVLRWDGRQLSLRLTLDPRTTAGPSEVTIQVPLAGCPGLSADLDS